MNLPQLTPVKWIAASNKYFAGILKPAKGFTGGVQATRTNFLFPDKNGKDEENYAIGIIGRFANINLKKGENFSCDIQGFVGPKEVKLLDMFDAETVKVTHLMGWAFFQTIASAMLNFLSLIKDFVGRFRLGNCYNDLIGSRSLLAVNSGIKQIDEKNAGFKTKNRRTEKEIW